MSSLTRSILWVVVSAGAVLFIAPGRAEDKPTPRADDPKKPTVMQRKLTHAQKALEGLAVNNFDKIRVAADGLIECVKDATWKINDTDKYLLYSNEFLRRAEASRRPRRTRTPTPRRWPTSI